MFQNTFFFFRSFTISYEQDKNLLEVTRCQLYSASIKYIFIYIDIYVFYTFNL
jgi:hypothetical protein